MPTHTLEDELYHLYDLVVGKSLNILIGYGVIRLTGFDRKNEEHLFVLRMALMARELYHIPVEVGANWWNGFLLNWKLRKTFEKVKIINPCDENSIYIPSLIGRIKSEMTQEHDFCVYLDNIYRTYYEGSCD